MSANSPTYQCNGGGTPTVNTSSPYCIVPGGHPRMAICCAEAGNKTVMFKEDCYSWCNLALDKDAPVSDDDRWSRATNAFSDCLSRGEDSRQPVGMVCGKGYSSGDAATVTPSSTSSTTDGEVPSTSDAALAATTLPSSGVSRGSSCNVKMAGAVGLLVGIAFIAGLA
ncbi:hypothetical protein MBLNU230_g5463t1 [Neophaeotheca triangularis]